MNWITRLLHIFEKSNPRSLAETLPDTSGPPSPEQIQHLFWDIHDAQMHELFAEEQTVKLFYIRSLVDGEHLQSDIVLPVLHGFAGQTGQKIISDEIVQIDTLSQAEELILQGTVLVFYDYTEKNTMPRKLIPPRNEPSAIDFSA